MAVLVDSPRWPAHGTVFAHLASDSSLWELHAFARGLALDVRAFDHDHYDLPERLHAQALAQGAELVDSRELAERLRRGGQRILPHQHAPRRRRARERMLALGTQLLDGHGATVAALLARYEDGSRFYHDVRHLDEMVAALRVLAREQDCEPTRAELLATLWHDAVYRGRPGRDEQESAELAVDDLRAACLPAGEVAEVERLVLLTAGHSPEDDDAAGARVSDADMAILASAPGRYHVSVRDIRREYAHLDARQWCAGRRAVLEGFLATERLYVGSQARRRWLAAARANLRDELAHLDRDHEGHPLG